MRAFSVAVCLLAAAVTLSAAATGVASAQASDDSPKAVQPSSGAGGGEPGTVYLITPDPVESNFAASVPASLDTHGMNPLNVLRAVKSMGGAQGRILLVGCEPADLGGEDGRLGLSDPVYAAMDEAIAMIETLISQEAVPQAQ